MRNVVAPHAQTRSIPLLLLLTFRRCSSWRLFPCSTCASCFLPLSPRLHERSHAGSTSASFLPTEKTNHLTQKRTKISSEETHDSATPNGRHGLPRALTTDIKAALSNPTGHGTAVFPPCKCKSFQLTPLAFGSRSTGGGGGRERIRSAVESSRLFPLRSAYGVFLHCRSCVLSLNLNSRPTTRHRGIRISSMLRRGKKTPT